MRKNEKIKEIRLLKRPEVEAQTGLSKSSIYQKISEGTFPAPVRLGKRAVAWRSDTLILWVESRETARKGGVE